MGIVQLGAVLRPVARMRIGSNVTLALRVEASVPPAPAGSFAWAVVERDAGGGEDDGIVVGGFEPNEVEAAVTGARALQIEQARRAKG
jgi:hypothetical protein